MITTQAPFVVEQAAPLLPPDQIEFVVPTEDSVIYVLAEDRAVGGGDR